VKIENKINYDVPTWLLIGNDPVNPSTEAGSALGIKAKIEAYKKALDTIVPEEYSLQMKQSNPFDFSDVITEDGGKEKWELMNFYHEPLATVYTTLTSYQANIRYLQMTVLTELFAKANANNTGNMDTDIAELAMKD